MHAVSHTRDVLQYPLKTQTSLWTLNNNRLLGITKPDGWTFREIWSTFAKYHFKVKEPAKQRQETICWYNAILGKLASPQLTISSFSTQFQCQTEKRETLPLYLPEHIEFPQRSIECASYHSEKDGVTAKCPQDSGFFGSLLVISPLFLAAPSQPSECSSYKSINEPDRSVGYKGSVKCDSGMAPDWYRFVGSAGDRLPEVAPDTHYCGTHAPGWLNGKHPTPPEGRVQRQVCFHWSGNKCRWSANIEVRNCGAYFVYKLTKPPVCSLRFCVTKGNQTKKPALLRIWSGHPPNYAKGWQETASGIHQRASKRTQWKRE